MGGRKETTGGRTRTSVGTSVRDEETYTAAYQANKEGLIELSWALDD